jgi:spermidine synthase
MSLELVASRVLAQVVGVSLYTWTGVIGVMLAGTACGNWLGGILADCGGKGTLTTGLVAAAAAAVLVLVAFFTLTRGEPFAGLGLVPRVLAWTFALFFLPMLLLGTVSPQAIRLATPDVESAGRVAGRVYAWSTAGAIAGTFATGYVLIAALGMYRTILGVALLAAVAACLAANVWQRRAELYILGVVLGAVLTGFVVLTPEATRVARETNYFTLCVLPDPDRPDVLRLKQDLLVHSWVKPADPAFLHYRHEQAQMEFLRAARPAARVLVIGGGGYTFPRAAKTERPRTQIDVVEIDPGVTAVAYSHLGLDPALGIASFNMDGRQFVTELATPATYDLVTLDAVNDLSVPYHLLTKECNDAVKRVLTPGGVYLVTVIDDPICGRLWTAAVHTLRRTFTHVELLTSTPDWPPAGQTVLVLYASDRPLDLDALRSATRKPPAEAQAVLAGMGAAAQPAWFTHRPPAADVEQLLAAELPLVLTDQFAPVDNLMAGVFRERKER